ncbi:MAG: hypothetical protein ABJC51_01260 [Acidobacteriota bacterium]
MAAFDDFKGILPYASELFGIYQPLLGWKSQRIAKRYDRFRASLYIELASRALANARPPVEVTLREGLATGGVTFATRSALTVSKFEPLDLSMATAPRVSTAIDSGVARLIASELGARPPADWAAVITADHVAALLKKFQAIVTSSELAHYPDIQTYVDAFTKANGTRDPKTVAFDLFGRESKVAGYLIFLATHTPASLEPLFFSAPASALAAAATIADPLLSFGAGPYDAILSPIGIIHLYREYFFEFDSFLGPPAGHVWLSPGGTVELVEISERRTLTEKSVEQSLETTVKSETDVTTQDDLADAVKEENRENIKFGFSATGSYSTPIYSASATADLSLDKTKSSSRESTHKQMRQQSEKLSSEIKRNFKTTFKTSTELTETSSKRYVISNTTDKLVNYELRRKMRKVGVQVQDIGVSLCWHTFVDDAGRELGISKFVHIGQPPDLSDLVQPEAPVIPTAQAQELSLSIPFVGLDTDDTDNQYTDGTETESGGLFDATEHIQADFEQRVTYAQPGFTLTSVDLDPQGSDALLSVRNLSSADGSSAAVFTIHLNYVNWNGQNQIPLKVVLHWEPSKPVRDAITAEYNSRMTAYSHEKARRYKEAFYTAARERIKLASGITPRPAEDLREEERTVVYRALISQLMGVGENQSKHVVSELVRSIFEVDRMLYFVAPEWWAPRLHRSAQHLGEDGSGVGGGGSTPPAGATHGLFDAISVRLPGVITTGASASAGTAITSENIVDWGGARELNRDNYYITEDSQPAKLGSSLGWLLQLDGDNLRNAFLNAPWVKAVMPIRIGKEAAALNWLQQAHVEGTEGLDAAYSAAPGDPPEITPTPGHQVTVRDALNFLIDRIQQFDTNARTPIVGDPAHPDDPSNHFAGSLPTEAVFEHGFYPLAGGVRFGGDGTGQPVFSQWMEILPTDQLAALAVEYDPKTLQVKDPPA